MLSEILYEAHPDHYFEGHIDIIQRNIARLKDNVINIFIYMKLAEVKVKQQRIVSLLSQSAQEL